jgi:hypothetical protein
LGLLLAVVLNFGRANISSAPSSDFDSVASDIVVLSGVADSSA